MDYAEGRLARDEDEPTTFLERDIGRPLMSDRQVPAAMAAMVPIEQGQTTIPADGDDPDAGAAPRSPSSYVVMVESQGLVANRAPPQRGRRRDPGL